MTDEYDSFSEDLDELDLGADLVACTIKLSRSQGATIKDLIRDIYPHTFPHYCMKVGISTPNFYSTLSGERTCSLDFLNKLLSGINYQALILNPEIRISEIEIGEIVSSVDSITQEIESQSNEPEGPDTLDSFL